MSKKDISLFVSDIHLSESRNDIVTAFFYFIENIAPQANMLYILGDLFDFWAGDDIETELTIETAKHFNALAKGGTEIIFIPGNRDFSLGKRYASFASMKLVGNEYYLHNEDILLIHGDELCTDDVNYQRYKKWIRHPLILGLLKRLPKNYRLKLADKIREKSRNVPQKSIIDVNRDYVDHFFQQKNVKTMIHGHTHRPAKHQHLEDHTRYVLSDWDQKGDYLKLENGIVSRHVLNIDPIKIES